MTPRGVLAYAGGIHASAAIHWLIDTHGVEVVTVTLDVGQGQDLANLRARALACGAIRAHVIDAKDEFARDIILPSLHRPSTTRELVAGLAGLPRPLIARKLAEIAAIEGTRVVAHGARDAALDAQLHAIDAALQVIAPAREWTMDAADLVRYARARNLPIQPPMETRCRIDQHLWGRSVAWTGDEEPAVVRAGVASRQLSDAALVDIHFDRGCPTSINGVTMSPSELIESLALIAGQHGIGRVDEAIVGSEHLVYDGPAAVVLHAAARAARDVANADVCLRLLNGEYTVLTPEDRHSLLVHHA